MTKLRIAIVQQAAYDWSSAMEKQKRWYRKYHYCIDCDHAKDCRWVTKRGYRVSLEYEYMDTIGRVSEVESFLLSDWCEWLSGFESGYLLERLKKEKPDVKTRSNFL